jgi:cysteine desulfurase
MEKIVYLDNNATTRTDPRVVAKMLPYFSEFYGNPSSAHSFGSYSSKQIDSAKDQIASLIHADPRNLIFTSGATESINLAIKGYATQNIEKGNHIITVKTEHKAVLDTCNYLEQIGFEISYLPVDQAGLVDLSELKQEIKRDTILVAIMWANNETGVIQPIEEIVNLCNNRNITFFTDATQAVGKLSVDVSNLEVHSVAFSGHKFYGPKGIGCLYIKDLFKNKSKYTSIIHGGGHQNNLRSGTLNVPCIIGLAEACEIARNELHYDATRIGELRGYLEKELLTIPGSFVNGHQTERTYNVLNICFPGVDANVLIGRLKSISVSNGSACTSSLIEPSHVLTSMGLTNDQALSSLRFSLGKYNTKEEIQHTIKEVKNIVARIGSQYA